MTETSSSVRAKVLAGLLISMGVVVLGGWSLLGSLPDMGSQPGKTENTKSGRFPPSRAPQDQESEERSVSWPWGDSPVAYGSQVPLEVATSYLRKCLCPLLPDTGPGSPAHVQTAWANHDGVVVLEFYSGISLATAPDRLIRADQWIAHAYAGIAADGWGRLAPLRKTQGVAQNKDEAYDGTVPSITWVEGAALITVAGHGPQVVDDLLAFAESLGFATQVSAH